MARRDARRQAFYQDQHGRQYVTQVDTRTGEPAEALAPIGWTAPVSPAWAQGLFVPPSEMLSPRQTGYGYEVVVDYDKWLGMLEEQEGLYEMRAQQVARDLTANYLDLLANPTPAFLSAMGPRPFPGIDVVQAMKDGEPWALGETEEVPAWVTAERLEELKRGARAAGLVSAEKLRAMREEERRVRLGGRGLAQAARYEEAPKVERVKRGAKQAELV
jgi:hypothetical protein